MGATVVYDQPLSALQFPDGVVIDVITPKTGALTLAPIGRVAFIGTSPWGQPNTAIPIGSPQDLLSKIGTPQTGPYDLGTVVTQSLTSGVTDVTVVRVVDTTQVPAILPIAGVTHPIATLTGLYPGSYINGAKAVLTYNASTPASQQSTSGNTQKVYVDLTIFPPNSDPEVFLALDGNVFSSTWSIDGPTLGAAIINAVNNGQGNGRGPSQWFIASVGLSSPGAPVMNTPNVVGTPGTDGSTFGGSPTITTAQLGSQATLPWTGMFALSGRIQGSVMTLVGNSNLGTTSSPALTFAKNQNAHFVGAIANGTSTTGALAAKTALPVADWGMTIMDGNWPQIVDLANGSIIRQVCSASLAAIRIALTGLPDSPANLPMQVIVGTGRIPANNQQQPNFYTDGTGGEKMQMENAGINYWTNDTAGDVGFAMGHNKNSLGKTVQPAYKGNIVYGRVIQFTAATFASPLIGQNVGLAQSDISSSDIVRRRMTTLANGFIQDRIRDGVYDSGSFAVCDLSNNTPGTGTLRVDLWINQKGIIDVVTVGIISGVGVAIAINPGQASPATQ